ncbi:hypothetical protein SAMCCGM7_Ch0104 [Sinorhizobium americanum CCGM7]|nr:hypothetical protein [Sinorhizobium americanum]APG82900.1 hypothetical protein SAMCCGM7_Ch0104 [Sinorhizobium americanum CCGM7]
MQSYRNFALAAFLAVLLSATAHRKATMMTTRHSRLRPPSR